MYFGIIVKWLLAKAVDELAKAGHMCKVHTEMLHHIVFSNQRNSVLCSA